MLLPFIRASIVILEHSFFLQAVGLSAQDLDKVGHDVWVMCSQSEAHRSILTGSMPWRHRGGPACRLEIGVRIRAALGTEIVFLVELKFAHWRNIRVVKIQNPCTDPLY